MTIELSRIPLFAGLSGAQLEILAQQACSHFAPRNTVIIAEGEESDSLYYIECGEIKIYVSDEHGREMLLDVLGPGDYFGELSLIDCAPRSATAMAVKDTMLYRVSGQDLRLCLQQNPATALKMLADLVGRLRRVTGTVRDLALLDAHARVTSTLQAMASERDGVSMITPRVTQQHIASMVGISREMVSRIMNELRSGGFITVTRDAIVIHGPLPRQRRSSRTLSVGNQLG
jgi:CRP/FNR family cyclic AMP-dependent transcriptional regulator